MSKRKQPILKSSLTADKPAGGITVSDSGKPIIVIAPSDIKYTRFNRLKTWAWNLILPPHVRLQLRNPDE